MKHLAIKIPVLFLFASFITSCATICGGSKYNARVVVKDRPNTKIMYKGDVMGTGDASFKVVRRDADKFSFTIKEDGCPEQKISYHTRSFRTWALIGTIVTWTGVVNGIPLPWGVALDLTTGALWKPNVREKGVSQQDYKNFKYTVDYTDCTTPIPPKDESSLVDVIYLKDGSITRGIITEQVPGVKVTIKTKKGTIYHYKVRQIKKMTREEAE